MNRMQRIKKNVQSRTRDGIEAAISFSVFLKIPYNITGFKLIFKKIIITDNKTFSGKYPF